MTRIEPRDTVIQKLGSRENQVRVFVRVVSKGNVFHIPAHRLRTKVEGEPKQSLWAKLEEKLGWRRAA